MLVYNANGVNPYAAEVSSLLVSGDLRVDLLDAVNGQQPPTSPVTWRRVLPANFEAGGRLQQIIRLLRGLLAVIRASGLRGDVLLVTWHRWTLESLVFAALARAGRPVVHVLHNPATRGAPTRAARWAGGLLLRDASVVVVHSERLIADVPADVRPRVVVCPHPPYLQSSASTRVAPLELEAGRGWLAFIGNLRPDKGIQLLPAILERLSPEDLSGLGVVVCGRGELPSGDWEGFQADGLALVDLTAAEPVSQQTLLSVLQARPLVLAPYVAASQSGTVILALSMGCRVLAFDQGGIPDVLSSDGLVPTNDLDAMARAARDGRGGTAHEPLDNWAARCGESWRCAVRQAGR